ncbi:hypothetical protein [Anaeromicropila herbilytica]|uniref:Uncharacterized protein n=1 Tax=Anaeromicropila herbilytica TaxID=2785025 RepID=A0A7R7EIB2_9FIRM|nr:hypothetical protein [Anaeromicropila herbilytica]BCN29206.1 hypothetical protein bsdtb5_05010 [Anaeromicropila herbilytica]
MEQIIRWLLEDKNPEIQYRTMLELLEMKKDDTEVRDVKNTLLSSEVFDKVYQKLKMGKKWETYNVLSAFAEFGLTREDIGIELDGYVNALIEETEFQMMCGEALLLRNLILLGYGDEPRVREEVSHVFEKQKPDGGYGCLSKKPKINLAKGCYRQTGTYLLLAAALKKKGYAMPQQEKELVNYYLNREVLYANHDHNAFVVPDLAGTFYPLDPVKIGLQMAMYSLSVLGYGADERCKKAWTVLDSKRDGDGHYILDKALSKPVYKIGKVGNPNKWVTLYALLAKKDISY